MPAVTDHEDVSPPAIPLYGLMEQLVRSRPHQDAQQPLAGRGVASNHDALKAVVQLATAIEIPAEAGDLPPEKARQMASMLLVIRDYIEPVAVATDDSEAAERLSRYLAEVIAKLP
jgi:hypothetical protein